MMLTRTVCSLAALCLVVAACSDSKTGETGEPGPDVFNPPPPDDGPPVGPYETPIEELTVDTGVSNDGPIAGEVVTVACTVENTAFGQEAPPTHWEVFETPADIAHAPEIDETASTVVFKSTGEYKVRCIITETGWADPTPVKVMVDPGVAQTIDTSVSPTTIQAGGFADVFCSGEDMYGNPIEDDWEVEIAPGGGDPGEEGGLVASQLKLKGLVVGQYEVACQQKGGITDPDAVVVTVEHGLPYRLVTTLGEDSIVAGGQTSVTCHAEDKQGNKVPDLPMTIHLPSALYIVGFDVGGTVSGTFVVKCVPAALDWNAFVLEGAQLEVIPGPPVSLELQLQPPKPFFATFEPVNLLVIAHDEYGNPVIDAEILPLTVSPDQDWTATADTVLKFFEEGYYTITGRLANDPSVSDSVDVAIEGAPPALTITYPTRGAEILGFKPSITVEGTADDAIAGIESVTVNGFEASMAGDGTFSQIIIPKWGMNILTVEATDSSGQVTTIIQSFYFAEKYYPMEPTQAYVADSLKLWLSEAFIDDGVHNPTHPDDLATILEGVFAGLDLSSMLPDSTEIGGGYALKLSNLQYNPPYLGLDPFNGGLRIHAEIKNFSMKVKLVGECKVLGIDLCPDFSGKISVDKIVLDADLLASAFEGDLDIGLANPKVNLEYIDLDIDGILGWLFDWLIDFLVNIFTGTIEDMIQDQLSDALEDTLSGLLESLTINETFDIPPFFEGMDPISLTLDSIIWSLGFTPEGGRLGLAARMLTPKKVPYSILGSIARGTCLKGYPVHWTVPGTSNFEFALYDDFLNQALTSIWWTGVLELSLDQEALGSLSGDGGGGFDLGGLPIDGIDITTSFMLPPILNGCSDDGLIYLQIGDAFVDVALYSFLFEGGVGQIGLYLQVELSAEIATNETNDGTAISILINDITQLIYHWEYVPVEFEGSEEVLEDLLETELIDGLMADFVGKPLGDFVIPEIDLGDFLGGGGGGPSTVIVPLIEDLSREGGHTLLEGQLE